MKRLRSVGAAAAGLVLVAALLTGCTAGTPTPETGMPTAVASAPTAQTPNPAAASSSAAASLSAQSSSAAAFSASAAKSKAQRAAVLGIIRIRVRLTKGGCRRVRTACRRSVGSIRSVGSDQKRRQHQKRRRPPRVRRPRVRQRRKQRSSPRRRRTSRQTTANPVAEALAEGWYTPNGNYVSPETAARAIAAGIAPGETVPNYLRCGTICGEGPTSGEVQMANLCLQGIVPPAECAGIDAQAIIDAASSYGG